MEVQLTHDQLPRSGCDLQPRVAAAATLGIEFQSVSTPMGLRLLSDAHNQRSRSGNVGLEVITASRYKTRHRANLNAQSHVAIQLDQRFLYSVEHEDVLILRVAHGRRDIEALFGD